MFKKYIKILPDDDNLRKHLGRLGRKRMQKNFDIDVIMGKLNRIYKSVI